MSRWSIAVFTLHFLLGLGASAFGKTPAVPSSPQANARAIQTVFAHQHISDIQAELVATAANAIPDGDEYNLADVNQDLPDDQNIRLFTASPGHALFDYPAAITTAPSAPSLKKQPKRPRIGHTPYHA